MLEHLLVVAKQVATLFLLMGVGFLLGKKGRFSDKGLSELTYLLLYVVAGCIIVEALAEERDPALLLELGKDCLLLVGVYLLYALVAVPLFRRDAPDTRAALQFGSIYGNTGFMGFPLILGVLGQKAMLFAAVSSVIFTVFTWIHGVILMGGRAAFSPRKAVLNPGVIALAVGLPFFLLDWRLPPVVGDAVGFLSDLNTPLAMVVIGAQMAGADLPSTFTQARLYRASFVKLVAIPLLTALVLLPFRLDPLFYSTAVLLAATPSAGSTSMFSQQFGRDTKSAAQLITLSTILSIVTLPLFAVLAEVLGR